jgi:hypothetical protein
MVEEGIGPGLDWFHNPAGSKRYNSQDGFYSGWIWLRMVSVPDKIGFIIQQAA